MKDFSVFKNLSEILSHPTSILTLAGLILLVFWLMKARKVKLTAKMMAHIGLALALSSVLHLLKIYHFPQGGDVTLGAMVPLLVITFFYGPEVGFLTGFLAGILSLILDPYIMHPIQVLFDYPLPSMALGLAGYFGKTKALNVFGSFVAIFAKFIFHFLSGVIFFGSYAPEGMSPSLYSLWVNGSIVGAEGLICLIIITFLPMKQLFAMLNRSHSVQG
jgi:thiamine transporter